MPERDLNQMLARLRLLEREYPKLQAERDELRQRCDRLTEEVTNQRALLQAERRKSAELQAARRERDAALAALAKILKEAESENSAIDSLVAIVGIINEMEVFNND